MIPLDSDQVTGSIQRFSEFCDINSRNEEEEDVEEGVYRYAKEYLGFTDSGLDAIAEYLSTDAEMVFLSKHAGGIASTMFVAGMMLGVAIHMEAVGTEVETDVEIPDPEDFA